MTTTKPKKLKLLVVDDEPDNLDLLYRTFRRDFNVLKADSGVNALEVLASEGEVAVIISDQRMPEMKGTEFLSKTVPQFPDTVRIILTGFTDIEDLVDAINAGQVYKYITKPWDPGELKAVVQRAAETYDLLKQRTEELRRANSQMSLLTALVDVTKSSTSLETTLDPIAKAFGESIGADRCILQLVEADHLIACQGTYLAEGSSHDMLENWLAQDPIVKNAIASKQIQAIADVANDETLASLPHYVNNNVKAHMAIPITYKEQLLAVLSIHWNHPFTLSLDELRPIDSSAQLAAIAIAAARCI